MKRNTLIISSLLTLGVVACVAGWEPGSPTELFSTMRNADPTQPEQVRTMLDLSHPFQVWTLATLFVPDSEELEAVAAACPEAVENIHVTVGEETWRVGRRFDGVCTLPDGTVWEGGFEARGLDVDDLEMPVGEVIYDHFTRTAPTKCDSLVFRLHLHGTVTMSEFQSGERILTRGSGGDEVRMTLDLRLDMEDECEGTNLSQAWDYALTYREGKEGEEVEGETYSGFGTLAHSEFGVWTTTTSELAYRSADPDCNEPTAGTITVEARGHNATLVADGNTACSEEVCSPWFLDGVEQGEFCGIVKDPVGCGIAAPKRASAPLGLLLLGAGFAILVARRRTTIAGE